jgi:hypothetical protein
VEAIRFRTSSLSLQQDMQMSGRVVWTGKSSLDVCMELQQVAGYATGAPFLSACLCHKTTLIHYEAAAELCFSST